MKRVLITGADGFVGTHLRHALQAEGFSVSAPSPHDMDITDPNSVTRYLKTGSWEIGVHLAGMSHVVECEKNPEKARAVNVGGTVNLLNATNCPLIFASTAQVYASPTEQEAELGVVFSESRPLAPQSFYAQTKFEAEEVLRDSGRPVTILRLFNHTHKTQPPNFFLPHIYRELLRVRESGTPQIPVGNLDLLRDIGSVRDLVNALQMMIRAPVLDTFNVCSGRGKNLRQLASGLAKKLAVEAEFVTDPARVRAGEPVSLVGANDKLKQAIGWSPQIQTEAQLIDDFMRDYP